MRPNFAVKEKDEDGFAEALKKEGLCY
jgi:hypothetical protein